MTWEHKVTQLFYDSGDSRYDPTTCELEEPDDLGTWELVSTNGNYAFWKRKQPKKRCRKR